MKSASAEDGKGKKKNRKSARSKRNRESKQTSIADIIDWETNLRRNTTVLYDLLPAQNNNGPTDIKTVQTTSDLCREGADLKDTLLQRTSNSSSAETLSSFFESASLFSVDEDEANSYEWIRLKTFSDWPLTSIFSTILARNGWVSLGDGDKARCYSCHVVHEGWRIGDNPDQYHSPNCRFQSGQSENIPIPRAASNKTPSKAGCTPSSSIAVQGEPRQGLESAQQDSLVHNEPGELSRAATKGNQRIIRNEQVTTCTTSAETLSRSIEALGINFDRPKYPSYAILALRISSYTDWPTAMTQTPRDMALAGFFYTGNSDYTRCFYCGGGLMNWESEEDPWFEHARWFKGCAFVQRNRGQEFIDMVQKCSAQKQDEHRNQGEKRKIQTNTNAVDPNSSQAEEEKVMRSLALTTIKKMGYSKDKIKAALRTIKSRLPRGQFKISFKYLLDVIVELDQPDLRAHIVQSERLSGNSTQTSNPSDSFVENTSHQKNQSDPAREGNRNDPDKEQDALNPELEALRQENMNLRNCLTCKICMEKKVAIGLSPCGHLVCCESCASTVTECPVCQENVTDFFKAIVGRQKNRLF